jgi:hypothetical protein
VAMSVSGNDFSQLLQFDAQAPDSNPICSDDSATAPDHWCGSANRAAPFEWDPTSRFVAYRSRDSADAQTLTIVAFTQFPSNTSRHFPAPSCGTQCSGQFVFQP